MDVDVHVDVDINDAICETMQISSSLEQSGIQCSTASLSTYPSAVMSRTQPCNVQFITEPCTVQSNTQPCLSSHSKHSNIHSSSTEFITQASTVLSNIYKY